MAADTTPPEKTWSRLAEAAAFAFALHGDQLRKGTEIPYIAHLMSVAALVLEHGGDQDQAIAGLLHDAIEDHGAQQEPVIRKRFGDRVADMARACTDSSACPKPPWHERKERYIEHLEQVGEDVLLVSACDKLHNARAIVADLATHGQGLFGRFAGGREGTLWYYGTLAAVFSRRLPGKLSGELSQTVHEMQAKAALTG